MAETVTPAQVFLARLVVIVAAVLVVLGLFWYGFSAEVHQRIWNDIAARPGGPMTFRFILQPCMAAIAAYHDGSKDARLGRSPYLWSVLTHSDGSAGRLREALIATARIILLGFAMDAVYQATVLKTFYPGEMLLIAILLAFAPYLLLRGVFARLVRWRDGRKSAHTPRGTTPRTSCGKVDPVFREERCSHSREKASDRVPSWGWRRSQGFGCSPKSANPLLGPML